MESTAQQMTSNKLDTIKKLVDKINKKTGTNTLVFGSDMADHEWITTPFASVNSLIKGLPRGRFTVVAGPEHTGKGAFCVQVAAYNQQKDPNFVVMWSDLENSFDREWAESLGLDLDRVIFHGYTKQANTMEKMMDIAVELLKSQQIDMWVLDSVGALLPKNDVQASDGSDRSLEESNMLNLQRKLGETLRKMNVLINRDTKTGYKGCSAVFIGQVYTVPSANVALEEVRGGNSLKHWAHLRLKFRRGPKSDWPKPMETMGLDGKVRKTYPGWAGSIKVDKSRMNGSETKEILIPFYFGRGFDATISTISAAMGLGIITRKGPYYECPVLTEKVQGKEELIDKLSKDPQLIEQLAALVDKAYIENGGKTPTDAVEVDSDSDSDI